MSKGLLEWRDTEVRDKKTGLCVLACFFSRSYYIAVTLRQHNYKHLPCSQSFTRPALMDVSHTGDSALLSPRHLTPLYLGLPCQREQGVMLVAVGLNVSYKGTRTDTDRQVQRDVASHSPEENDDTSVLPNLSKRCAHT